MAIDLTKLFILEVDMKILIKIAMALFVFISIPSIAGEKVDKSLSAKNINEVTIENLRGEITINGWDQAKVSLKGELDDEAKALVFEQRGSSIVIKIKMPRHLKNNRNVTETQLVINMPADVRVNFSGVSSNVNLNNLQGGSEVSTVSGEITAHQLSKHIDLNSVSGNIISDQLSGKIRLATVSGNIDDQQSSGRLLLKAVSGDIETKSKASEVFVNNVSGDIELELGAVDELVIATVSGDIEGELALTPNATVKLSSISGNIEMKFTEKVSANFRLEANAGGDLVNKLTHDKAKHDKYGPSSRLYFQTGNGAASVRANTISGTIKMK